MKIFEYRVWKGIASRQHQVALNLGRVSFSASWIAETCVPLKWVRFCPHHGACARWARSFWIYKLGVGVALDFIGLHKI